MISVGQSALSLDDFSELIFKHKEVALDKAALNKVNTNYEFLKKFSSHKLIYGINTGFGPMAQYKVNENIHRFLILSRRCFDCALLAGKVALGVAGERRAQLPHLLLHASRSAFPSALSLSADIVQSTL